jgi:GT2 family glycosyltransferase
MKFCFVILHYLNLGDTIKCVSSIFQNIRYPDYFIILVDNASPDNSGQELAELYVNEEKVTVLLNSENLGYAKGMNSGASYAAEKHSPDFICILNNDTIITQEDFIDIVISRFNKETFHFLGPDIISKTGSQNPYRETMVDLSSAKKGIKQTRQLLFLNYIHLDKVLLKYVEVKHKLKGKTPKNRNSELINVGLHGACIIFSKAYIYNYPSLFYPGTFLYMEENILSYIRRRDNLVSVYLPQLKIFHSEDGSINMVFKKKNLKRRAIYKLRIDSIRKFLELIKNPAYFTGFKNSL